MKYSIPWIVVGFLVQAAIVMSVSECSVPKCAEVMTQLTTDRIAMMIHVHNQTALAFDVLPEREWKLLREGYTDFVRNAQKAEQLELNILTAVCALKTRFLETLRYRMLHRDDHFELTHALWETLHDMDF